MNLQSDRPTSYLRIAVATILCSVVLGGAAGVLRSAVQAGRGPYFEQRPPGTTPQIFAAGIVSTSAHEFACSFTPDGNEFYFTRRETPQSPTLIMVSRCIDGLWTVPEPAPFSGESATQNAWSSLHVSFRGSEGTWGQPRAIDLGTLSAGTPTISPDGKYLFFTAGERGKGDIYWVAATFLNKAP